MNNSMFRVVAVFMKLCWMGATTKSLKLRLLCNIPVSILNGVYAFLSSLFLSFIIKSLNNGNPESALNWFFALFASVIIMLLMRFFWRYAIEAICLSLEMNLKTLYFERLFHKPYSWHLENSVGYFSTALERVSTNISTWLRSFPVDFIPTFVMTLCFLGYTLLTSAWLFLYFLAVLFGMWLITRLMYNKRIRLIGAFTKQNLRFNKLFIDFLYNVRSIKKMNLLDFTTTKITQKALTTNLSYLKMIHYNALQWVIMEFIIHAVFLLPAGFYLYQYIKTGLGIEIVVMIATIQPQMGHAGRMMMHFMTDSAKVLTEYQKLSEHLGDEATSAVIPYTSKFKQITFENTLFEYIKDGHIFKHQVPSFTINRGDHIAVTGKSGEGKSTFLNLVTGQFSLKSGAIKVDGESYATISQDFFDKNITYISQDVELFDISFYDNIVMGQDVSQEALQKILEGCQLTELVNRMQGNLYTELGEKGVKVSAGERQRINLARGLLLNRDILVLDEITANLDPITTEKIWSFIFSEYKDKTIIAVSHETQLLNHINKRLEFKKGMGKEIKL